MKRIYYGQLIETGIEISVETPYIVQLAFGTDMNDVFIYEFEGRSIGWASVGKTHNHWNSHREDQVEIVSIYDLHFSS